MKTNLIKFAGAIAWIAAIGCGAANSGEETSGDGIVADDDIGTIEEGLMSCSNPDGANSAMAALAVAVAQDLGRWQVTRDFYLASTDGRTENSTGSVPAMKLLSGTDSSGQPRGKSRCADGKCARVQALLDMQYQQASGKVYLQGSGTTKVLLDPNSMQSRIAAKWGEQVNCDATAKDGDNSQCPKEEHKLTFVSSAVGGCDRNFTFHATKPDGSALSYPNQLKNKLKFEDPTNPYLGFANLGAGNVSIDPTYGVNDDGSSSTGSCVAACTKISTTPVSGCCSCGGVSKNFVKSAWSSTTFLCQ